MSAREAAALALVLLAAALGFGALTLQDEYAGFNWDDAYYLLLADKHFGRLADAPRLARELVLARGYPPLYPLWLGSFGGGSAEIARAYAANLVALLGAGLAFFVFMRRAGIAATPALALLVAFFAAPATLRFGTALWSENLYLAWQFVALAALAGPRREPRDWTIAALACCCAALTRSVGFALVGALLVALVRERPRRWPLLGAFAVLPPMVERAVQPGHFYGAHGSEPLLAGVLDPARVAGVAQGLWDGWAADCAWSSTLRAAIAGALLLGAAFGYAQRARAWRLDALMIPLYVALLFLWGFPEHSARFAYPLLPLALAYAALAARARAGLAAFALVAAIAAPTLVQNAERMAIPAPPELAAYRRSNLWREIEPAADVVPAARLRRTLIGDMRAVRALVPSGDCVSSELPPVVMAYAHRWSEPSPWRSLNDAAAATTAPCRFYYAIPAYLAPGAIAVDELTRAFVIRYVSPGAPGVLPTGLLLEHRQISVTPAGA